MLKTIADIRRDYGELSLEKQQACHRPFDQFQCWFEEILTREIDDPTAMVLATVDEKGMPDTRVVLLKQLVNEQFIFFTHYSSAKGRQIAANAQVALNFYWPSVTRQVRIRGTIEKISREASVEYFTSRPRESQLAALASPQSNPIDSRQTLLDKFNELQATLVDKTVPCPESWGGYCVKPEEYIFFQGRDYRLHDSLKYIKDKKGWRLLRLAP